MTQQHHQGLTASQVRQNREKYGVNVLTPPEKDPLWKQFLEKFSDPIIKILLLALVLSIGVSFYHYFTPAESGVEQGLEVFFEPIGILVAILLATCVGFAFEVSANRKFEILNQVNDETMVQVIRDGKICEIPRCDVVVGDIVVLNTGEEVPADGTLLEAVSLQVNESTLTGEPLISKTTVEADFHHDATYPSNQVMKGTTVVDGHGIMVVTAVGDKTEYGKVYEGSQIDNKVQTPLNIQLSRLGDLITWASYAIAALIIFGRLYIYFSGLNGDIDWLSAGQFILNTVMIAVTVIVVTVPEGLPMSVTLSLALSMKSMLESNNLVRKMHACETMGATTMICTDKTGTLTRNQMTVHRAEFPALPNQTLSDDELSNLIREGISANSTAFLDDADGGKLKVLGNPTEGALLLWLNSQGSNYLPLREAASVLSQLTFSTERKYMATFVQSPLLNKKVLYVKGAPEIVMNHCSQVRTAEGFTDIAALRPTIDENLFAYQNQAMRTLGMAYRIVEDDVELFRDGKLAINDLIFLGYAAISDPVRDDVPQAVQDCMNAGIGIKIVTGDTPGTAREIGRQIGLWKDDDTPDKLMTGVEFEQTPDEELLDRVVGLKIMCRARPMDKERLVKLLQQKGQVVAVTGDGTNDAPALNAAQVGLSMGDGTTVAKEASAITILDNSFMSISRAVMWGRSLYRNIQRFIVFQMTINVAACLIVLIGAFLGTESPLTVTQMLWVNLIMDTFAALALASLPPDMRVMQDPPRKTTDHIITPSMGRTILGTGIFFVVFLFGLLQYFKNADLTSLTEFSISDYMNSFFVFSNSGKLSDFELSVFFTTFVILQFWNMFNAKAFNTQRSAFANLFSSLKGFGLVALLILAGQYLIVTFGGNMFQVTPLSWTDWGIIIAATSIVLWVGEIIRLFSPKSKA
ncbi:MAG: calcium-translocating P-type ATPase, PMCA-type [Akkermansia sp.]|nr:calcium-translocating P-type ATPase, PMCA-type [Akkermansia sp.]